VLGCDIEHSGHFTQHSLAAVFMLVTFDGDHPIGFVNEEVDPGEFLRPLPTERDHCLTVGCVTDGFEELVHSLLSLLPPLVCSLSVVPFDMRLQIAGLYVAGLTVLRSTHERTVVVMNHRVFRKVVLL
jgi:hypothetical protein